MKYAVSILVVFLSTAALAVSNPDRPTVGREGQLFVTIQGTRLEAKPVDEKTPLALRIAQAIETRIRGEAAYLACIRTALLSFARGDAPMTCVEFARRNVEPHDRPSFSELETIARRRAA